jgi:type II restriction enzyme
LKDGHIGDLLVLVQFASDEYRGFVLESEEEVEEFLAAFNLDVTQTNRLIARPSEGSSLGVQEQEAELPPNEESLFAKIVGDWGHNFIASARISEAARAIVSQTQRVDARLNPDLALIAWLETEYRLFKAWEIAKYGPRLVTPFQTVDILIEFASSLLNSRKVRAGHSFEHHLTQVFNLSKLPFDHPGRTEGRSQPDFLMPAGAYFSNSYPSDKLIMLAAKTTCKDRWRQILKEANRIPVKHLCTLQQGISSNQLEEMKNAGVVLVVPAPYKRYYPPLYREGILSLSQFISFARETLQ